MLEKYPQHNGLRVPPAIANPGAKVAIIFQKINRLIAFACNF